MRAILVAIMLMLLPIVSFGTNPNSRDKDGMTPLMEAASKGDMEQVKKLVSAGARVNDKNKAGMTPLMYGAGLGSGTISLDEKERQAQIDLSDKTRSPIVKFLIEKGAKLEEKDIKGETAIFWAVQTGQIKVLNILMDNGADINSRNRDGYTPLICAVMRGENESVRLLIDKGADTEAKTLKGDSALSEIAFFYLEDRKREMMKILGAKPNSNETSQVSSETMPKYTVFSEQSAESPVKAEAQMAVIVSEPTTEKALVGLIHSLYDKLNQKSVENHKQLTYCVVWIYLSKQQAEANQFAIFLRKKWSDPEPVILKNDDQLSHLNDKPLTRFGLNDSERKKVFEDICRAYSFADSKTDQKYPYSSKETEKQMEQRHKYLDKLRDQQMGRLSKKWELRTWMLDRIFQEGYIKGWFVPVEED